ncbi:MAG: oxalurate catabolism protein HpxZ [Pseudomonadota bacterium]
MEIDNPEVVAEVTAAFARYEAALVGNDVETLMELFWRDPRTIRYGVAELLYGIEEIEAFRKGRSPKGLERTIERTELTTYGRDFATTAIHYRRHSDPDRIGRQMQTWVRMPEGWRVVAAHVSVMDAGAS